MNPILELTDRGFFCPPGDFYVDPWKSVDRAIITHIPPINRLTLWWRESGGRDWLRTRSKPQLRNMLVDFREVIDMVKAIQSEFQLRPDDQ